MDNKQWFFEKYQDILAIGFKFKHQLFNKKSQYQTVVLFEHKGKQYG